MAWETTDVDVVSAEERELGAFAGKRIVDNIDDIASVRLGAFTVSMSSEGTLTEIRLSSVIARPMVVFIPLHPEAHTLTVSPVGKTDKGGVDVFVKCAIGMPGGAIKAETPEQFYSFGTTELKSFDIDLKEPQQRGLQTLPVLIYVRSIGTGDISPIINLSVDSNERSKDGTEHGIAATTTPNSYSVIFED